MEVQQNSPEIYKCEYCNNNISILTKKLQQHYTSNLWMKHGQCCAACIAPRDITGIDRSLLSPQINNNSKGQGNKLPGDHNTNIAMGFQKVSEIEEEHRMKVNENARRYMTAGNIIIFASLLTGFVFVYYEFFILAVVCSFLCLGGIFLCRLGVWKKCRIR